MKKKIAALAMSALISGLVVGTASAALITDTYQDTWINFPGWDNPKYTEDEINNPQISHMEVKYYMSDEDYADRHLHSVNIYMTNRLVWDSLFINIDATASFGGWDYMAREQTLENRYIDGYIKDFIGQGLYEVADGWDYTKVPHGGRNGHPNGINPEYLNLVDNSGNFIEWNILETTTEGDEIGVLTYTLSSFDMILGDYYMMAYTPWCANDVIGVPEPGTLLLFGAGLAGLFGVARRRQAV